MKPKNSCQNPKGQNPTAVAAPLPQLLPPVGFQPPPVCRHRRAPLPAHLPPAPSSPCTAGAFRRYRCFFSVAAVCCIPRMCVVTAAVAGHT
ncbi:hypothetical protein U1Q18_014614 [Sarracenia purpurea var. burkii]